MCVLGRFSPDSRFLAYLSNEAKVDTMQLYVRPFDASKPEAPGPGPAVQVSKDGANGMIAWRQDGRELYFMTRNWEIMAVDVTTTPTFQAGPPQTALQGPGSAAGAAGLVHHPRRTTIRLADAFLRRALISRGTSRRTPSGRSQTCHFNFRPAANNYGLPDPIGLRPSPNPVPDQPRSESWRRT